jgi:hypothetical protein
MNGPFVRIIVIAMLFLGFSSARTRAQQRGPSTAEERTRAVRVAHQLEENPLGPDAEEQRTWMVQWVIDIPDITVNVCSDYFGKLPQPSRGHSSEIFTQMLLSSAAFMIEHPDKVKDDQAVALAGLLGSLKAYEAVVKKEPAARWPEVEKLVKVRDEGKLDDFVADTLVKCRQDNQDDPAPGTVRTI